LLFGFVVAVDASSGAASVSLTADSSWSKVVTPFADWDLVSDVVADSAALELLNWVEISLSSGINFVTLDPHTQHRPSQALFWSEIHLSFEYFESD
jgi:hypothetical protein